MSTTPPDPKEAIKKERNNGLLWAILAAILALFMFSRAPNIEENNKRIFYYVGGGMAALLAAVHGYGAYVASSQLREPK